MILNISEVQFLSGQLVLTPARHGHHVEQVPDTTGYLELRLLLQP